MVSLAKHTHLNEKKSNVKSPVKKKVDSKVTSVKGGASSPIRKKNGKTLKSKAVKHIPDEDNIYQEPLKKLLKPLDQLSLNEEQLKEEIVRVLTGDDPNAPRSKSRFNFRDRCFKPDPPGQSDHMATHFALSSCVLHKDSVDFKSQKRREDEKENTEAETRKAMVETELNKTPPDEVEKASELDQQLENTKNQFNYSERAAQTFNFPQRQNETNTEPPPVTNFGSTVNQWQIYDGYTIDYINGTVNDGKQGEKVKNLNDKRKTQIANDKDSGAGNTHSMAQALKLMERLVNQNAEDEIYQDFKYWEDASDQFREGQGSLLPLWRFSTDRTKRKQVTALCWNPQHYDLFAVGYGSYDFLRQGSGKICCFSLKNTSYPEYIFSTESGVMCLDFHPLHPSLLAVGCYDGTVLVYNICNRGMRPIYSASAKTGKHSDPVWQVCWQVEDMSKDLCFYSISTDGTVANWAMSKNELNMEPIMHLKLTQSKSNDELDQDTSGGGLAGGCCFDFNTKSEHLFIIGTEEGYIHKCSKAYSGQYLETYEGHNMPIYAVKWNPFHENVFLSCSADWTVKLWDHKINKSIMSFDLGNSVGGICWSPYSATVFAAVTSDGKVHVFDIAENKLEPMCEQKVVKRSRLTHVSFSPSDYILIVGDDRGGVNSLKLSPNLRKIDLTLDKNQIGEVQRKRLDAIISSVDIKGL